VNNDLQESTIASDSKRDSYIIVLTDEERDTIHGIIDGLPELDLLSMDDDQLFTQIELAQKYVPDRIARMLIDFRRNSNQYGTLLFHNLPVDPTLPPTPGDGRVSRAKTSHVSEYGLLLMMMFLGEPIAYADEKEGMLIQNICPVKGNEEKQENTGSVYLEFHTEDGFHPYKPDFLGLTCLRSDHDRIAKTISASVRNALHRVPSKAISILRQPFYRIRLSSSFTSNGGPALYSAPMAVLSGDVLEPELCIDFHAMEAMNVAAHVAMDLLKNALMEVAIDCALLPGDLIIVDNRVAAHARTSFRPRFDGEDRWLQRLFVVHDFRRSRGSRPQGRHVCTPLTVEFCSLQEITVGSPH